MPEYSNIKVKPGTFDQLNEDKPDGVSWDYYLRELHRVAGEKFEQ